MKKPLYKKTIADELKREKPLDLPNHSKLPSLVHIDCPECNTPVKAENISLDKMLAKCGHCDAVFSYQENVVTLREKPTIFLPKGIEILKLRNELELKYKWRNQLKGGFSFMLIFGIFWNLALIPFVLTIGSLWALLPLSGHLAVGLGIIYYVITSILNETFITVDKEAIYIEHRPFSVPFYRDQQILVEDIQQVYVGRHVTGKINDVTQYAFGVNMISKKEEIVLLKGIKHLEIAQYIEQEIELFLNIEDQKVKHEWSD